MKKIIYTAAAAAAVLAGSAAMAAPAMASNGPITAVTHLNNHPDTTISTPTPLAGNVWAYDNATEKFTITPTGTPNTYLVMMDYVGSFHGFADPVSGAPFTSDGSVKGTIAYDVVVTHNQLPDPAALPGQVPSDTHIAQNITALFDGNVATDGAGNQLITQVGDYNFSYQNGNYVQGAGTPIGDVVGH